MTTRSFQLLTLLCLFWSVGFADSLYKKKDYLSQLSNQMGSFSLMKDNIRATRVIHDGELVMPKVLNVFSAPQQSKSSTPHDEESCNSSCKETSCPTDCSKACCTEANAEESSCPLECTKPCCKTPCPLECEKPCCSSKAPWTFKSFLNKLKPNSEQENTSISASTDHSTSASEEVRYVGEEKELKKNFFLEFLKKI